MHEVMFTYMHILTPYIAQWSCVLFQPILSITNNFAYTYLALLIFCEGSLSKEKKANFLFKSGFFCYLGISFTTFGNFPVLTNWHCCQGIKVHISHGKNDKDCKVSRKKFMWERKSFHIKKKRLYIFPGNSTLISKEDFKRNLGFQEGTHTR